MNLITDFTAFWRAYLSSGELAKAALCILIAHGSKDLRPWANLAALWFAIQAMDEAMGVNVFNNQKAWEYSLLFLAILITWATRK